jgi:hypothetical protein
VGAPGAGATARCGLNNPISEFHAGGGPPRRAPSGVASTKKFVNEMVKGVLKERGLMPARDRARSSALSHTSLSGGEGQMVRARRLSVRPSKPLETGGLLHYRATTAEMAADCV